MEINSIIKIKLFLHNNIIDNEPSKDIFMTIYLDHAKLVYVEVL